MPIKVKVRVPVEFNFEMDGVSEEEAEELALQEVKGDFHEGIPLAGPDEIEAWLEKANVSATLVVKE